MGLTKEKRGVRDGGCLFTSDHKKLVASSGILETPASGGLVVFQSVFLNYEQKQCHYHALHDIKLSQRYVVEICYQIIDGHTAPLQLIELKERL
ncbi:hypothetical protein A4D02_14840 [Niastella koreensis]|nr:hypothetical protein A4D02_14840 [Niastella koreensis]